MYRIQLLDSFDHSKVLFILLDSIFSPTISSLSINPNYSSLSKFCLYLYNILCFISQYEKKPVVFVGEDPELPYWIRRQVTVNESSWNGRLFRSIMIALDGSCDLNMKYVGTNVNPVMPEYLQLQDLFSYCGYDITVVPDYFSGDNTVKLGDMRKEAAAIAVRRGLGPYQIIDNGKYLIVNLGGQMKGDTEFLK